MNVTEKEATKLRCCGPEGCGKSSVKTNAGLTVDSGRFCIGAKCMAWQFDVDLYAGPDSYVAEPGPTGHCGYTRCEVRE